MSESRRIASLGFVIAIAVATLATAQDNSSSMKPSSAKSSTDVKFVKEAADGGMAEVELGQLAVEKASNEEVKKFGQRMVDDHGKANDKLKEIASSKGIELPQEPSAKHKAIKERLSKLSGTDFDHAYMADMLKDHKMDIAAFTHESTSGKDAEVKSFASDTLPTLQDHLKNARSASAAIH
jgi:putative membrane protein